MGWRNCKQSVGEGGSTVVIILYGYIVDGIIVISFFSMSIVLYSHNGMLYAPLCWLQSHIYRNDDQYGTLIQTTHACVALLIYANNESSDQLPCPLRCRNSQAPFKQSITPK